MKITWAKGDLQAPSAGSSKFACFGLGAFQPIRELELETASC